MDVCEKKVVTLMLFDINNDVHAITAFKKNLSEHEMEGSNIEGRLANIVNKEVKLLISPSKGDDPPILNKLIFVWIFVIQPSPIKIFIRIRSAKHYLQSIYGMNITNENVCM